MKTIQIGSDEHRDLFCKSFVETHRPYRPEDIRLLDLDSERLARLKSLPVWNEAVRTESETAMKVQTLGKVETDPVLAEAISLQGYEEGRHAAVISLLTRQYGISVAPFPEPRPPADPVGAFISTGYGECMDSFFAFGLFAIGKRSQFFPADLIDIFEPIMQEEARHILFLVNWAAYLRARTSLFGKPFFDIRRTWKIGAQVAEHALHAARIGKGGETQEEGFTMTSHQSFGDLSARSFLELCLSENERRLSPYDSRLLRPQLVPSFVRLVLKVMPRPSRPQPLSNQASGSPDA